MVELEVLCVSLLYLEWYCVYVFDVIDYVVVVVVVEVFLVEFGGVDVVIVNVGIL